MNNDADWMDDTDENQLNADVPRLKKKLPPKHKRANGGLTASVHLLDALDDLAHSLKKEGISRPDLVDEALTDLLSKYKVCRD